jgi:hypothetical protein
VPKDDSFLRVIRTVLFSPRRRRKKKNRKKKKKKKKNKE